jgi:hypothetical protein
MLAAVSGIVPGLALSDALRGFRLTSATELQIDPPAWKGPCPGRVRIEASIATAGGEGTVHYKIVIGDAATQARDFTATKRKTSAIDQHETLTIPRRGRPKDVKLVVLPPLEHIVTLAAPRVTCTGAAPTRPQPTAEPHTGRVTADDVTVRNWPSTGAGAAGALNTGDRVAFECVVKGAADGTAVTGVLREWVRLARVDGSAGAYAGRYVARTLVEPSTGTLSPCWPGEILAAGIGVRIWPTLVQDVGRLDTATKVAVSCALAGPGNMTRQTGQLSRWVRLERSPGTLPAEYTAIAPANNGKFVARNYVELSGEPGPCYPGRVATAATPVHAAPSPTSPRIATLASDARIAVNCAAATLDEPASTTADPMTTWLRLDERPDARRGVPERGFVARSRIALPDGTPGPCWAADVAQPTAAYTRPAVSSSQAQQLRAGEPVATACILFRPAAASRQPVAWLRLSGAPGTRPDVAGAFAPVSALTVPDLPPPC